MIFLVCLPLLSDKAYAQNAIQAENKNDLAGSMIYHVSSEMDYVFEKPKAFQFLRRIPSDFSTYFKSTFTKKNTWKIGAMVAGTAVLVAFDQPIIDASQKLGNKMGLDGESPHQKTIFEPKMEIGNVKIRIPFNMPMDVNTSMYFIGDGWTHTSIAMGFWCYGRIMNDNRARHTASELAESIILSGISTQVLKHLTGRQSPYMVQDTKKNPGGIWRVFPNQFAYAKNVPNYDAFPSGHLATAMATFTVISENYPEYRFIKPLGYTLLTALSFAMLNNGVHWISDYPLSLAMGYAFAKISIAHDRHIQYRKNNGNPLQSFRNHFQMLPSFWGNSGGISIIGRF